jgi:hypothetical protein
MRDFLLVLAVILLIISPYALVAGGVLMLTGELGWAFITLGVLILVTVFGVAVVVNR